MEILAEGIEHANERIRGRRFYAKDEIVSIREAQTTRKKRSVLHEEDDPVDLPKM